MAAFLWGEVRKSKVSEGKGERGKLERGKLERGKLERGKLERGKLERGKKLSAFSGQSICGVGQVECSSQHLNCTFLG